MNFIRHTQAIESFYKKLDELIENNIFRDKNIIMFGTSKIAGMIIYYLKIHEIKINNIIDNDKKRQGEIIFGSLVIAPEQLDITYRKDTIILIASYYQNEMIQQLKDMGYEEEKNIIKVIDLPFLMNDYSFVDRSGFKIMEIEEVRKKQLNILKHLKEVSKRNGLRYFLSGGTLLGAIRHKGYIPWDDDIDVFMEIKDLKKLVEILKKEKDYSIISFVDDIDYYDECSFMVDNYSIMDSNRFPMQVSSGVSIDIFPLCGLPDDKNELKEYVKTLKDLETNRWNKLYSKKECRQATKELVDFMCSYDFDKYNHCGCLLTPYFIKEITKKEYFSAAVEVEFEGEKFAVPIEWDKYLTQVFGDYMQLPPIEKRVAHHFFKAYYKQ